MKKLIDQQIEKLKELQNSYDHQNISKEEFLDKIDKDKSFEFIKNIIEEVKEDINYNNLPKSNNPKLQIITGQPGSGKSYIVEEEKQYDKKGYLILDSDMYREYTPYHSILEKMDKTEKTLVNDSQYFKYTQSYASVVNTYLQIIGQNDQKNIIFQTMGSNDNNWLVDMAKDYQDKGYKVGLETMLTNKNLSSLLKDSRYLQEKRMKGFGRWVDDKSHNVTTDKENGFQKLIKDFLSSDIENINVQFIEHGVGTKKTVKKPTKEPYKDINEINKFLEKHIISNLPLETMKKQILLIEDLINNIKFFISTVEKNEDKTQKTELTKTLNFITKKSNKYKNQINKIENENQLNNKNDDFEIRSSF